MGVHNWKDWDIFYEKHILGYVCSDKNICMIYFENCNFQRWIIKTRKGYSQQGIPFYKLILFTLCVLYKKMAVFCHIIQVWTTNFQIENIQFKARVTAFSKITWSEWIKLFVQKFKQILLSYDRFPLHGLLAHKLHPAVSCECGRRIHKQELQLQAILKHVSRWQLWIFIEKIYIVN